MISKLLFTYITNFLAVKPKLIRFLVNMDLGLHMSLEGRQC
jgi:hypothetical protein